jgi:hypothetical protein
MSRDDSNSYDSIKSKATLGHHLDGKAPLKDNSIDVTMVLLI